MEINKISGINTTNRINRTNTATGTNFGAMPTKNAAELLARLEDKGANIDGIVKVLKRIYVDFEADTYQLGKTVADRAFAIRNPQIDTKPVVSGCVIKYSENDHPFNIATTLIKKLLSWEEKRTPEQIRLDEIATQRNKILKRFQ